MGLKHCAHAVCPVPVGVIKAIEVEADLNLPVDALLRLSKIYGYSPKLVYPSGAKRPAGSPYKKPVRGS
jgi:hypothetical protein